uniref:C3H1-type domain-containing protein n=1 Tax=Vitis vinifera TaxID=29760 RepID=A5ANC2_VITVI|nr:hypothetical protein VITISV_040387 [Vitis vinifera]
MGPNRILWWNGVRSGQCSGLQRVDVAVGLRSRESYLERSGVADCVYYMKIGFCGFGSRCRYNHHRARSLISTLRSGRGEYPERIGEPNIKEVLLRIKMNFSEMRIGSRLIKADSHQSLDSSVEMSDELASTLASIQEFMAGTTQVLPLGTSHGVPFHLSDHCETTPPPIVAMSHPIVNTTNDTRLTEQEARVERLEARVRQVRLQDEGLTWDDRNGIPAASLPAKFRMPNIERYSGIGCPKIHLRLYNTAMRSHGIDDAQLVALFPMSLSGADQR